MSHRGIGPHNVCALAALVLRHAIIGMAVTDSNFYGPAISYVSQMVWGDSDTSVLQKASRGLRRPKAFLPWDVLGPSRCGRQTTTTRRSRPGKTLCHIPTQAWMKAPASCGCGGHAGEGVAKVLGEPITSPRLRGAPRWPLTRVGGG
jgi:hypothetical protein